MTPKIPSGWRRLRRGEKIKKGDRTCFTPNEYGDIPSGWATVIKEWIGTVADDEFYIRRIRKRP